MFHRIETNPRIGYRVLVYMDGSNRFIISKMLFQLRLIMIAILPRFLSTISTSHIINDFTRCVLCNMNYINIKL